MKPWYQVVTPRQEVREGRSFNPDEFAIALEQVVARTAPPDYREPGQFFARTCFTRALREHAAMVLRRLAGHTENTAPVLTLITQFGGGKTHALTALYHLASHGEHAREFPGVSELVREAVISAIPRARVAVFVGNAWDPQPGRETPWIDVARQLADEQGVEALGTPARTSPPGTEALGRVFRAANAPVLLLFDEVLNFVNRHRQMAEPFHAFIQNLTVAITATTHSACVISLPRSQVEMTDWDWQWQERIAKVVRRVAKDLIANDEAEISEVIRRRLFEDLGSERIRSLVTRAFADWCFERRAQLPSEWTAVDTATTEARARELLRSRFEACYPFHPATLSVFQRKWQALPQYQQTRGTLAMLAQWVAWAYRTGFTEARREPLITLGSAPLHDRGFRSTILGQLGENRLLTAIEHDIAGEHSHARALDADSQGPLRGIHRRVGAAILFESSGGQTEKVAYLPELRFALGEPQVDTTSVDHAAFALEDRAYFIRRVGSDGFRISHQPTLKKVVHDRRASLDVETEIRPTLCKLIEAEFRRQAALTVEPFPEEGAEVADTPRLRLIVLDPELEWTAEATLREKLRAWTYTQNKTARLYPGALIWCLKRPGRELRQAVELLLAWQRVAQELAQGVLGSDADREQRSEVQRRLQQSREDVRDEIWGGYRFVVVAAPREADGLRVIDLGAGHASNGATLSSRIILALKSEGLLSEDIGAGYLDRQWPEAFKATGAWPLQSLRQSFLNGTLTRLLDPEAVLRRKIPEFVMRGDFGLAYGPGSDGAYERVWYKEPLPAEEVSFEPDVFLLRRATAEALLAASSAEPATSPPPLTAQPPPTALPSALGPAGPPAGPLRSQPLRIAGTIPPEVWNKLGTRVVTKLRQGSDLTIRIELATTVNAEHAPSLMGELRQALLELGLTDSLRIEA